MTLLTCLWGNDQINLSKWCQVQITQNDFLNEANIDACRKSDAVETPEQPSHNGIWERKKKRY